MESSYYNTYILNYKDIDFNFNSVSTWGVNVKSWIKGVLGLCCNTSHFSTERAIYTRNSLSIMNDSMISSIDKGGIQGFT